MLLVDEPARASNLRFFSLFVMAAGWQKERKDEILPCDEGVRIVLRLLRSWFPGFSETSPSNLGPRAAGCRLQELHSFKWWATLAMQRVQRLARRSQPRSV
eukprot:scaffold3504_cov240-Pinguiococcus_pyrenoidosus.AAC.19